MTELLFENVKTVATNQYHYDSEEERELHIIEMVSNEWDIISKGSNWAKFEKVLNSE